jgi:hypothetical protein
MWNRFISSPYAHLVTAVAVTLGLALVLLTAHPQKMGFVEADNAVRPPQVSLPTALASDRTAKWVGARNSGTTGQSP